jgi:four helix bundle suffix protein
MANVGLTLCYQVDAMMNKYLQSLEQTFIKEGGIKERMHKARTDYRRQQDERLAELEHNLPLLQQQLTAAQQEANRWKTAYEDLKQRALNAYYRQQDEIQALKQRLNENGIE